VSRRSRKYKTLAKIYRCYPMKACIRSLADEIRVQVDKEAMTLIARAVGKDSEPCFDWIKPSEEALCLRTGRRFGGKRL
jgi:hypothetical protein